MTVEADLQRHARLLVRAGFHAPDALLAEVVSDVEAELPGLDATVIARAWIAGATAELRRDAATWPDPTDHQRLTAVFAECEAHDVAVLAGVAEREVTGRTDRVVWFDRPAVWGAIETGVLTLQVRGDDALRTAVSSCVGRHGLAVRPATGGIDVRTWWQRRQDPPG